MDYFTNLFEKTCKATVSLFTSTGKVIKKGTQQYILPYATDLTKSVASKAKQLYQDNKQLVIGTSAVLITYLIMRKSNKKQPEKQNSIKKSMASKKIALAKSFISQQSQAYEQQTRITKRQAFNNNRQVKTQIFFSQQQNEQQEEDKIFFEVYKTYLTTN